MALDLIDAPVEPRELSTSDNASTALLRRAAVNPVFRWMCAFSVFVALVASVMLCGVSYLAYDSSSWPTTVGEVIESREPISEHGHTQYRALVRYRFQMAGETFTRRTINLSSQRRTDEASAQAIVDQYPLGAKLDVHYYPKLPRIAVLEPGPSWQPLILALGSLSIGAVGAMMLWWGTKIRRENLRGAVA